MGIDIHAVAAWGIKTTWGKLETANRQVREWVGSPDGNREFDFDPRTGRPNYLTRIVKPAELEKWEVYDITHRDVPQPDDVYIIVLAKTMTTSHRNSRAPITAAPVVPDSAREEFIRDMERISMWSPDDFDLWVFLDISV